MTRGRLLFNKTLYTNSHPGKENTRGESKLISPKSKLFKKKSKESANLNFLQCEQYYQKWNEFENKESHPQHFYTNIMIYSLSMLCHSGSLQIPPPLLRLFEKMKGGLSVETLVKIIRVSTLYKFGLCSFLKYLSFNENFYKGGPLCWVMKKREFIQGWTLVLRDEKMKIYTRGDHCIFS